MTHPGRTTVASLVAIWRSALNEEAADENSDFVDLGGTSLTATRIRAMIRIELAKDVDLLDILDNPTPATLGPAVDASPPWDPAADPTQE